MVTARDGGSMTAPWNMSLRALSEDRIRFSEQVFLWGVVCRIC